MDCVSGESSFFNRVYVTMFLPMAFFVAIAGVGALRALVVTKYYYHQDHGNAAGKEAALRAILNQTVFMELLLSYVCLPTVVSLQFKALWCVVLEHDGSQFLKEDSSINCLSPSYR